MVSRKYLKRRSKRREESLAELKAENMRLKEIIALNQRKIKHGCTDANCSLCHEDWRWYMGVSEMTKVTRPVRRETIAVDGGGILSLGKVRPVIVSIEPPNVMGFRLKGQRKTFHLTAEYCFLQAVKAQLAAEQREKNKNQKTRRIVKRGILS